MFVFSNLYLILIITLLTIDQSMCYMFNLTLPKVTPTNDDQYFCASFRVPHLDIESYILSYESMTNNSIAHHMLIFGCNRPYSIEPTYDCGGICAGESERVLFAWAKDGSKFQYPSNTGMPVGGKTGINFIILQVHFLHRLKQPANAGFIIHMTDKPMKNIVGIMMMFSYYGIIPGGQKKAVLDVSCKYSGQDGYPLAFRTHTHDLGRSLTGYLVSHYSGDIKMIGKANPQWPQSFYKPDLHQMIQNGDIIMLRCLYDSRNKKTPTNIGSTHNDEMCNFYIMLVTRNNGDYSTSFKCGGNEYKDLWKNIPTSSMEYSPDKVDPKMRLSYNASLNFQQMSLNKQWKVQEKMGDVTSVSMLTKKDGSHPTLLVLHRADRRWKISTFMNNLYAGDKSKPITEPVLLQVHPDSGKVLKKAGGTSQLFMPHGLTASPDGRYIWITDVARHQVMRFKVDGNMLMDDKPNMILGERFVPGNDRRHFCKPAKVAIDQAGNIFVADGYCNNRVICFYANGSYADEWRPPRNDISDVDDMFIVHSITIQPGNSDSDVTGNIVWVADRNNQRVLAFTYDGNLQMKFGGPTTFKMPVFAIAFNKWDSVLYGIETDGQNQGQGFTIVTDADTHLGKSWIADSDANVLTAPHDMCLARMGSVIYVAELFKQTVLRFERDIKYSQGTPLADHLVNGNVASSRLHQIIKKINPLYLGLSLLAAVLVILLCVVTIRIMIRCRRYGSRKNIKVNDINGKTSSWFRKSGRKRYGKLLNDPDGFQPLTQDDPEDDDDEENGTESSRNRTNIVAALDNSSDDPETEEFSAPQRLHNKRPKV